MFIDDFLDRLEQAFAQERFGYDYREGGNAEAAALGALALMAHGRGAAAPLDWLEAQQRNDGGVPALPAFEQPRWPTGLALWAFAEAERAAPAERAKAWLLANHGRALAPLEVFGHDQTLVGWSWIDDTHSWVEPTGYALHALRRVGATEHSRFREGVELLLDRCLPDGGWNYGNTRVMSNMLRPFPATTGVALLALAGEPRGPAIERSLDYLRSCVASLSGPLSLAWSLLALAAWEREAPGLALVEAVATRPGRRPADPVRDALLLLAASRFGASVDPGAP